MDQVNLSPLTAWRKQNLSSITHLPWISFLDLLAAILNFKGSNKSSPSFGVIAAQIWRVDIWNIKLRHLFGLADYLKMQSNTPWQLHSFFCSFDVQNKVTLQCRSLFWFLFNKSHGTIIKTKLLMYRPTFFLNCSAAETSNYRKRLSGKNGTGQYCFELWHAKPLRL